MDLGHLAKDMQMVCEDMMDGFNGRQKFMKQNQEEVHQHAAETHKMMNGFKRERVKNAKEQRNDLEAFYQGVQKRGVQFQKQCAQMMNGMRDHIHALAGETHHLMAETQKTMAMNKKHLKSMHQACQSGFKTMARKRAQAFAHAGQ